MKNTIKLFFVFVALIILLEASASSNTIDLYFANGMNGESEVDVQKMWLDYVDTLSHSSTYPDLYIKPDNAKVAYNASELGGLGDFFEVEMQKVVGDVISWAKAQRLLKEYVLNNTLIEYYNAKSQLFNFSDLHTQIESYKTDLRAGHSIIVVAHSQGNFFTNKVYETLSPCQQKYFKMIGVASPSFVISGGGPRISFDNDPVPMISFAPTTMGNPNRNRFKNGYGVVVDLPTFEYHGFAYYMGGNAHVRDLGIDKTVSTNVARVAIEGSVLSAIDNLMTIPEITPKSGIVNVQLTWGDSQVDMDLKVDMPFGEEDITDCKAVEHFYVESEDDIETGTYPVYIHNTRAPDESLLPQNIYLAIDTPGEAITFDFSVSLANMLNIGHVADIVVTADGEIDFVNHLSSTGHLGIVTHYGGSNDSSSNNDSGSGDGSSGDSGSNGGDGSNGGSNNGGSDSNGSSSGNSTGSYSDYVYKVQSKLKQATMGPLSGATIKLFEADDYLSNIPLYVGATTGGSSLLTTGVIYYPSSILDALEDEKLYVLSVQGGTDIDVNDDGVIDSNPTVNNGSIRAILSGKQLQNDDFKVNILTEIVFQATKKMLNDELNASTIIGQMDAVANKLLSVKEDTQELSDYNDTLHWLPMFDKEQLNFNYNEDIEPIVQKIYQNEDIYLDVYKLLYAGKVDGLEVDDNETDNSIHMTLNPLTDFSLLQKEHITLKDSTGNSVEFTFSIIDSAVVINPLTDLIEGESYTLAFDIAIHDDQNNTYLDTHQHELIIPDTTPPIIPENIIHIDENRDSIPVNAIDPSSPLKYTIVSGLDKELFEVKSEYYHPISFKEAPNYERPSDSDGDNVYELEVSVADRFSNVTTQRIQIIVDDVKEGPLLADTNMTVDENSPIGTYVGSMTVVNEGDGNLTSFELYDDSFRIDNLGKIYTKTVLDYERIDEYNLSIRARNNVGAWAVTKKSYIKINDIDEPLPEIHSFTGSMDDHAPSGKVVGQLYVYSGLDTEAEVRLVGEGADDFDVNTSGYITVSATADLNHEVKKQYDLKAIASNSYGESAEANVTIYINIWTKQIGTEAYDSARAFTVDKQSNTFLISQHYDSATNVNYTQITKRNSNGEVLWQKDVNQSINSMVVDDNGTVYLAGSKTTGRTYVVSNRTYTAYAARIMALSSTGDTLWSKIFDVGANSSDYFSHIVLNSQNELLLAGRTNGSFSGYTNQGSYDLIVAKLSRDGDVDYIHQIGTASYEIPYGFKVNKSDEPYMLVYQSGYKLLKLDQTNGHVLSSRSFGDPSDYSYYDYKDFIFDDEGNIYTLIQNYVWWEGNIDGSYVYQDDFNCVISKLDPNMNEVWTKSYGTVDREFPESIAINSKNEVYFTGMTEGSLYSNVSKKPYLLDYDDDIFLIKIDSNGEMVEAKQFGTISYDSGSFIEIDLNDDIYMAGSINESLDGNNYFGNRDVFLMKVPY